MRNEISPERLAVLKKHGFDTEGNSSLSFAFCSQTAALDAKMLVRGDHATDCSHIYYAREESSFDGLLDGLFYSPSMLEYLLLDFGGEWKPERTVKDISAALSADFRLVFVGGYPMLFTEVYDYEWEQEDISDSVSEMLRLIGALDYTLSKKWHSLMAKRRRAYKNAKR